MDVAGIDCGAAEHYVSVPPDRDPAPVHAFRTFTADLERLADWLVACRITSVAMEATGVYWVNSIGRRNTSMMRCYDAETATKAEKVRPGGSASDALARSATGRAA